MSHRKTANTGMKNRFAEVAVILQHTYEDRIPAYREGCDLCVQAAISSRSFKTP
jgi:hypothetical protein